MMLNRNNNLYSRRGSVIVMVVAILTLLFIIGATLLVVTSHDYQSAKQMERVRTLRAINETLTFGTMQQLREDVVGRDGIPYNNDQR